MKYFPKALHSNKITGQLSVKLLTIKYQWCVLAIISIHPIHPMISLVQLTTMTWHTGQSNQFNCFKFNITHQILGIPARY